ncbi:unnamed protein product [Sphenostylis stenocarpa]|uniref:Uncharacterized protein n=1 Tax=Sphenostylis stenocarpa TaxID=92480 RepID=A0AA86VG79_9FABA|nr:unnamed protein product [Sphenostylis stenocarpa]
MQSLSIFPSWRRYSIAEDKAIPSLKWKGARAITHFLKGQTRYVFTTRKSCPYLPLGPQVEGKWYHMPLASAIQMLELTHIRGVVECNAYEKEFCEIRALMPDEKSLIKDLLGRKGKEWRKGRQWKKRPPL